MVKSSVLHRTLFFWSKYYSGIVVIVDINMSRRCFCEVFIKIIYKLSYYLVIFAKGEVCIVRFCWLLICLNFVNL